MNMCSIVSDSVSPPGSWPSDFSSENTRAVCYFLLPGDLPDAGIEPGAPALQVDSLLLSH